MTPFYRPLASVTGFGVEATAQQVGVGLAAVVGGLTVVHAVGSAIRRQTVETMPAPLPRALPVIKPPAPEDQS